MKSKLIISGLFLTASLSLPAQRMQLSLYRPNKVHKLSPRKSMASLPNIWVPVSMEAYG